ncbi:MAG: NlpC/P60 family protein [Deltaproteobacteria bacterium]|nr:NlpC/P60 family protein [Deltaproteobacteria bacterium]
MANRIILSAVITLALTFSPSLAFSVPTKGVKKKSSSSNSKTQSKVSKKSKSGNKAGKSRSRSQEDTPDVVQSAIVPSYSPTPSRASVPETPPLMKVTPQRDGKFILEPLSPKKPGTPLTKPSSKPDIARDQSSLQTEPKYNRFEPWDFSELILTQAKYYRDTPYSRGGSLQTGSATDCSGFVQYIYHGFKIDLPRSSAEQAQVGKVVTQNMDFSKLLPGDLLFFRRGGYSVGHAGIYLGEGKMIHASNHRNGVTVTDLRQPYYEGTFVVAKRVFEVRYPN